MLNIGYYEIHSVRLFIRCLNNAPTSKLNTLWITQISINKKWKCYNKYKNIHWYYLTFVIALSFTTGNAKTFAALTQSGIETKWTFFGVFHYFDVFFFFFYRFAITYLRNVEDRHDYGPVVCIMIFTRSHIVSFISVSFKPPYQKQWVYHFSKSQWFDGNIDNLWCDRMPNLYNFQFSFQHFRISTKNHLDI